MPQRLHVPRMRLTNRLTSRCPINIGSINGRTVNPSVPVLIYSGMSENVQSFKRKREREREKIKEREKERERERERERESGST